MKITSCRFDRSVYGSAEEPRDGFPLVAFLGRSNVGKSSLINRLLGSAGLARTSSQPGRTRCLNFYRVNEALHFVDLPGYGYAAVSKAERESWGRLVEGFLERRKGDLAAAVLVLDARHAATPLDLVMRDWLRDGEIPWVAAATKADKLSGNGRAAAARSLAVALGPAPGAPALVSAESGMGIAKVWSLLDARLEAWRAAGTGRGRRRGRGEGWTSAS